MLIVYLEPVEGLGYRATVESPMALSVEGATRAEAVSQIKAMIRDYPRTHGIFWPHDLLDELHPLQRFAGDMDDDPLFEEWREAMAEYRRKVDLADNIE